MLLPIQKVQTWDSKRPLTFNLTHLDSQKNDYLLGICMAAPCSFSSLILISKPQPFLQPTPMRPTLVSSSSCHRWWCWWPSKSYESPQSGEKSTILNWWSPAFSHQKYHECFGCSCFWTIIKFCVTHLRNFFVGHYPPFHRVVHEIDCKKCQTASVYIAGI